MNKEVAKVPVKKAAPTLWSPHGLFDELQADFERLREMTTPLFSRGLWRNKPTDGNMAWMPKMDVFRKDGNLVVKADLPGMKKQDITVELEEGDLVLQGERREEKEVKEEDFYRCERTYGSFYRRLPLPAEVHAEQIKATFKDGVLEVMVPMPMDEIKPEKVMIS